MPGGETRKATQPAQPTTAPWADDDARTLSLALVLSQRIAHDTEGFRRHLPGVEWKDGARRGAIFAANDAGDVFMPKTLKEGQAFCVALWPQATGAQRLAILAHSDGTTLVCQPSTGDEELSTEHVLGAGAGDSFANTLRQPGKSRSGDQWMWLEQFATTASITVVDEAGAPIRGLYVLSGTVGFTGTELSGAVTPIALPIACGTTDALGVARLRGPMCTGSRLSLRTDTHFVISSRLRFRQEPSGLQIVVPKDASISGSAVANESAAIATLKNIASAQAQCRASSAIDADQDGRGEYGFFGELTGKHTLRSDANGGVGSASLIPPVLSAALSKVRGGRVERNGYVFQIWLPAADGTAKAEADLGGAAKVSIDPNRAEQTWCAYAWPIDAETGRRCFFVNQDGDVLSCANHGLDYVGNDKAPLATAAFAKGSDGTLGAQVAANTEGVDGATWRVMK